MESFKRKVAFSQYDYIPIVLGSNINGLGIVRGLGEEGLPVIVADHREDLAFYSKYAYPILIKDSQLDMEGFLDSLEEIDSLLKSLGKKGVLYIVTDPYLYAVGENMDSLEEKFKIVMDSWDRMEKLIDKSYLYKLAEELDIPYPKTYFASGAREILQGAKEMDYPLIVKPAVTVGFSNVYKKAVIVNNKEELKKVKAEIEGHGLENHELIIQEMILGPVENLYTYSAYSNREGQVKAYSIGYKIRQSHGDTGTIMSGRVVPNKELARLGKGFIRKINFYGISNTEFKLDERDGIFKLIEINPRSGVWNYSARATGVNLPWLAYQDTVLNKDPATVSSDQEIVWIYDFRDFSRAVLSGKASSRRIGVFDWFKSVRGRKVYPIFNLKDIRPFFRYVKRLIGRVFNK